MGSARSRRRRWSSRACRERWGRLRRSRRRIPPSRKHIEKALGQRHRRPASIPSTSSRAPGSSAASTCADILTPIGDPGQRRRPEDALARSRRCRRGDRSPGTRRSATPDPLNLLLPKRGLVEAEHAAEDARGDADAVQEPGRRAVRGTRRDEELQGQPVRVRHHLVRAAAVLEQEGAETGCGRCNCGRATTPSSSAARWSSSISCATSFRRTGSPIHRQSPSRRAASRQATR